MKFLFSIFLILCLGNAARAQDPITPLDLSPMDMAYFPTKYPILKIQNLAVAPLIMRVIYSRPHQNGRKIFGGLQQYGEIWRMGANEATEIQFFKDVIINQKKVSKGRYTLYAIVYGDKWTVIVNKQTDTWGAFKYDSSNDVVRMDVPVIYHEHVENMTINFTKLQGGANMNVYWENVKVSLPILFYF
ncbi:MAG: DUF2911 domain-containing protein [Ginsengibacter sp.]